MNISQFQWTREPKNYSLKEGYMEIITEPHTDLWQRTYYHFRNDNAPVFQMETEEKFFSFTMKVRRRLGGISSGMPHVPAKLSCAVVCALPGTCRFIVKTDFSQSGHRFDQCGVVMYLDSENWIKASVEYENEEFQHLGSVVTNHGYSDWATTAIPADVRVMWYRFSRREDDYCIGCSRDGVRFSQMRICHMWEGGGKGPVRNLCLQPGGFQLSGGFHGYEDNGMCMEGP